MSDNTFVTVPLYGFEFVLNDYSFGQVRNNYLGKQEQYTDMPQATRKYSFDMSSSGRGLSVYCSSVLLNTQTCLKPLENISMIYLRVVEECLCIALVYP